MAYRWEQYSVLHQHTLIDHPDDVSACQVRSHVHTLVRSEVPLDVPAQSIHVDA